MRIIFYSTKEFERKYLEDANKANHTLHFVAEPLSIQNVNYADGFDAACVFPGDDVSQHVIRALAIRGIRFILVRAAGYDNVDLETANELMIRVANVPAYSPNAIAEHTVAMMLALTRNLILANSQVHAYNFRIDDLIGFNLQGKRIGIVGTGKIGSQVARILYGFDCELLAFDIVRNHELERQYQIQYVSLAELRSQSDIITLHLPLNRETFHLVDKNFIGFVKPGVMLINTARGGIVHTAAIIEALQSGKIGAFGMDVYEKESGIFFFDHSINPPDDKDLKKLLKMPNVLITPHQAFATVEAIQKIADTTFHNARCFENGTTLEYELTECSLIKYV